MVGDANGTKWTVQKRLPETRHSCFQYRDSWIPGFNHTPSAARRVPARPRLARGPDRLE